MMLDPRLAHLGDGRHRTVYTHKQFVVKVPVDDQGAFDNDYEYSIYRKYGAQPDLNGIQYARCRLMSNGWLVMEHVVLLAYEDHPKWADYVDCQQVGRGRDGRIVAYDYGYY